MSGAFSVLGLIVSVWVYRTSGNAYCAQGVLYFVLMELLQFVQYYYIATDVDPTAPTKEQLTNSPGCQLAQNQFLTFLGYLHVCYQPLFTHYLSCAFMKKEGNVAQFQLIRRLCLVGGTILLARHLLALYPHALEFAGIPASSPVLDVDGGRLATEWLSGPVLCTYQGLTHLAWSIPLIPPSYYVPSMQLHSFLMFVPFFVLDCGNFVGNCLNVVGGLVLFVTGPVVADSFTSNKQEAASIWCFFSIMQICGLVGLMFMGTNSKGRWYKADVAKWEKTKLKAGKRQ